jgi:hypothetical protein
MLKVLAAFAVVAIVALLIAPLGELKANHNTGTELQFRCDLIKTESIDPLVDPEPAHAHSHQFSGNLSVNADSTFESLENSTAGTSCHVPTTPAGPKWKAAQNSYWTPELRDATSTGSFQPVSIRFVTIYYADVDGEGGLTQLPEDYGIIASNSRGDVDYRCGSNAVRETPPVGCTNVEFRVRVLFPNCLATGSDPSDTTNWIRQRNCPSGYTEHPALRISTHYNRPPDGKVHSLQNSIGANEWGSIDANMHGDVMEASLDPSQQGVDDVVPIDSNTGFKKALERCAMIAATAPRPDDCGPN